MVAVKATRAISVEELRLLDEARPDFINFLDDQTVVVINPHTGEQLLWKNFSEFTAEDHAVIFRILDAERAERRELEEEYYATIEDD